MRILAALFISTLCLGMNAAHEPLCATGVCRCVPAAALHLSDADFVRRQRDRADQVILGRVIGIDTLPALPIIGAHGQPDSDRAIVARVHVQRVWRGPVADTMLVQFRTLERASTCDLGLQPQHEYVIFASRMADGLLVTAQCTGTVAVEAAAATLAALGEGMVPRP